MADGTGITIAIVDSGVDVDHEDLSSKIVQSVNCIGSGGDFTRCEANGGKDDDGHGTHVAGIAAAATNNEKGVAGVAPGASIMAVRVLRHSCDLLGNCTAEGAASDVVAGIDWAANNGADVINLSLGNATQAVLGPAFAEAISRAWAAGAIPVVAAGNDFVLGSGFSNEPALVVSAVGRGDTKATYSTGVGEAQWGIAAPGGDGSDDANSCASGGQPNTILSTYWHEDWDANAYACLAGTSMAAPHVSGAAALLRSAGLDQQQTVDRLLATAKDLGAPGRDRVFGSGRVDVTAAMAGLGEGGDGGSTTTATDPPATTGPDDTTPPGGSSPTTGAGPSTTASVPPPATTDTTTGSATAAQLGATQPTGGSNGQDDDLPTGPVVLAVLLILLSAGGNTWWTFRRASWARRTPG